MEETIVRLKRLESLVEYDQETATISVDVNSDHHSTLDLPLDRSLTVTQNLYFSQSQINNSSPFDFMQSYVGVGTGSFESYFELAHESQNYHTRR